VTHLDELGEETNTLPFDTVDDMIAYAKYPVFVHYAYPEPKPEYCIYDMYQMVQHAMTYGTTAPQTKTSQEHSHSSATAHASQTSYASVSAASAARALNDAKPCCLVASGLTGALKHIYKAADDISHPIFIIAQDPGYTATDSTLLSRLRDPIRIVPDPEALLTINASSLVISHAPAIPVKPIVADLAAEAGVRPAALFWCRTPHVVFPDVDTHTVLVMPESGEQYTADLKTRRVLDMLQGYERLVAAKCVPGVHWCRPEDYAEEGNGEWLNWVGNMEFWIRKE
jgi:hypothetical protein